MPQVLITGEQMEKLRANGREAAEQGDGSSIFPVVKLFTPDAGATWLITEIMEDCDTLFGLCDLGLGAPELGYVSLTEIRSLRGKMGLPVERDEHFKADQPISAYTESARRLGGIFV